MGDTTEVVDLEGRRVVPGFNDAHWHLPTRRTADLVDAGNVEEIQRRLKEFARTINIPLQEPDEDTGQTLPNPDFVRVMKANFPPDTTLLLGCRTCGRSVRASQMLEVFGFTNLTNVKGRFEGLTKCELPITTTPAPGHTYADQLTKADGIDWGQTLALPDCLLVIQSRMASIESMRDGRIDNIRRLLAQSPP